MHFFRWRRTDLTEETGRLLEFEPRRIVQAIAFHLLERGGTDAIDPISCEAVIHRLQRRFNRLTIPAKRWAVMDNDARLRWLLERSRIIVTPMSSDAAALSVRGRWCLHRMRFIPMPRLKCDGRAMSRISVRTPGTGSLSWPFVRDRRASALAHGNRAVAFVALSRIGLAFARLVPAARWNLYDQIESRHYGNVRMPVAGRPPPDDSFSIDI